MAIFLHHIPIPFLVMLSQAPETMHRLQHHHHTSTHTSPPRHSSQGI